MDTSLTGYDNPSLAQLGRTHMVGIGGAGMSVIAQLLRGQGVSVSGCDRADGSASRRLREQGIDVKIGHDHAHVENIDTLIISTAVRPDNPDLVAAKAANISVLHRSQALAALMAENRAVAVAGTHGKTTTTALAAAALHQGGVDASVAIGAQLATGGAGAHVGSDPVFVAEADESDGSFLRYRPDIAIVTNLEPDHLDHYGSAQAVREAFETFVAQMPEGSTLIACADDPGSASLAQNTPEHVEVITYGLNADADVQVSVTGLTVKIATDPREPSGARSQFTLQTPGLHNALNASAAWIAARLLGASPQGAIAGLEAFTGAERRFQVRGTIGGRTVVDDYAHHPTEVEAVIEAARSYISAKADKGRVIAVLQPHLPSRTKIFAREFASALQHADVAIVLDVFLAREDPDPDVNGQTITQNFSSDFPGLYLPDSSKLAQTLVDASDPGDVILMLGAGDIPQLTPDVLKTLKGRGE